MASKIQQLIQSSTQVTLTDAVNLVEDSLGENATVNSIALQVSQGGFLVYTTTAIDPQGRTHEIVVDADDGRILLDRPAPVQR